MEQLERDVYELSTGRKVAANAGYIGLNQDLEVSAGYDNGIQIEDAYDFETLKDKPWTPDECADLADFMIARWQQFKATHSGEYGKA